MKNLLDSQEFYDYMQRYRVAPIEKQEQVIKCFESVKRLVLNKHNEINSELLEALIEAQKLIEKHLPNELTAHDLINNAINKAQ